MANVNVRFYKLNVLPDFDGNKHKGIFVHVTKTMKNIPWKPTTVGNEVNPATLWMEPEKSGGSVERINLVKWLSTRHITEIASGLWFGGENGWELLSNEITDAAINAAITTKIQGLHADGYAQAEINTATNSSTLTIKGIKEDNGIISEDTNQNFVIAIDGVYDKTNNKIATESTIDNKIGTLDASAFQTVTKSTSGVNTVLTFNGIKEVDGIISQGVTENAETVTVGDAKLKIQIGSNEAGAFDVFSANAIKDSTIKLDGLVFKKDDNNVISVITKSAVASNNRLVTELDIASLGSAMHYKGPINNPDNWPTTVAAGDVYISTVDRNFIYNQQQPPIEPGDMIVFNSESISDFTVVQSNLTLGTGDGQIAANVGNLADGKLVVGVNPTTGSKGIKTVDFDVTNLTGTNGKNERNLTLDSKLADRELQSGGVEGLYHSVGITDTFTIMGRDMSKSFSISSRNRSISIEKVGAENSTDAQIDLIWNTVMDA